jgi:hypothetical protein
MQWKIKIIYIYIILIFFSFYYRLAPHWLCSSPMFSIWIFFNTYINYKIFKKILKIFLTCVLEIPDPLSLNIKMDYYKNKIILSTIVIKVWPILLNETKKNENYYKFLDMNVIPFQDLILTFKIWCMIFCSLTFYQM